MDRAGFTGMMNTIDGMSDTQLTIIWAYVRDVRAERATARATERRSKQNVPPEVAAAPPALAQAEKPQPR